MESTDCEMGFAVPDTADDLVMLPFW